MRSAEGQIKLQSAEGQTTRFRPWTLDFPAPRPAAAMGTRQQEGAESAENVRNRVARPLCFLRYLLLYLFP